MRLDRPWLALAALMVVSVTAACSFAWGRRRLGDADVVAHTARLSALPRYAHLAARRRRQVLGLAAATLALAVALTMLVGRPVRSHDVTPDRTNRDIMLCLDVSGSMVEYNESIIVQFGDLIERFEGERVGMTIFNSSAVVVFPMTTDYDFVRAAFGRFRETFETRGVEELGGSLEGDGSSLVPDGIASCALSFPDEVTDRSRSIVVATDNQVEGSPLSTMPEVTRLVAERAIRVYTIFPLFSFESVERPEILEMRNLTGTSGGAFYAVDNQTSTRRIVERIERTEAARFDGAPQLARVADPRWWLGVAVGGMLVLAALAARSRT